MSAANKSHGKRTRIILILGVLVLLGGWFVWENFFHEYPQQLADESIEEFYKYGSIGTENEAGIPYWIWLVLPKMFPEYLPNPGGWASLGFAWEQGRELPVGISKKRIGFERVGINCALCHAGTLRASADAAPTVFPTAPATTFDALGYQNFLFRAASDPRFTAGNILEEIAQVYDLPLVDRLIYRFALIPATRKALLEQKEQYSWTNALPYWGRGRIDPFNPVKVTTLDVATGDTTGNSDMEPIWNMRPRVEHNMALHWDGLNTDLTEVVLSSAIGDGTSPKALPIKDLARIQTWIMDLQPPRFEDYFAVDADLAAAGKPIFDRYCAECHAFDGERTGQVLKVSDRAAWDPGESGVVDGPVNTDPERAYMWTPEAAQAYNQYAADYPWSFSHFRSTSGYVNVPLDGLWLRAPYLHNGSVPYLTDLLDPPAQRTKRFLRGLDVYDSERMGFVTEGPDAERVGTLLDTSERGNSNQGHLWGTALDGREKRVLLEYLKTL
jgi:mono/diheme cytochrome c family protein